MFRTTISAAKLRHVGLSRVGLDHGTDRLLLASHRPSQSALSVHHLVLVVPSLQLHISILVSYLHINWSHPTVLETKKKREVEENRRIERFREQWAGVLVVLRLECGSGVVNRQCLE